MFYLYKRQLRKPRLEDQGLDNLLCGGIIVKLLIQLTAVAVVILLLLLLLPAVPDHGVTVQLSERLEDADHLLDVVSVLRGLLLHRVAKEDQVGEKRQIS